MRLFANCRNCSTKIYISSNAQIRAQLPSTFNLHCPHCGITYNYYSTDIFAEQSVLTRSSGAFLGGLLGSSKGAGGALLGAIVGALIGSASEDADNEAVARFNLS